MPHISKESIEEARQMDLLSWMQANEPDNLVRISGNNYCTRDHDSLKISNGKWYWFSRGIGGYTAMDYLIKVREYTFFQAVEAINGIRADDSSFSYVPKAEAKKALLMPELVKHPNNAIRYLKRRGIHEEVIRYCLDHSMLFETAEYHNVLFVGYDRDGIARYGALRGTMSTYKGEVTGSDKHYSFSITENCNSGHLHLFESAIDLLSYASLQIMDGKDWKTDALLSLAGVFKMKETDRAPVALTKFLDDNRTIEVIHLHLDNDDVGRGASEGIMKALGNRYTVIDEPPETGKDMNDTLLNKQHQIRRRKEEQCR